MGAVFQIGMGRVDVHREEGVPVRKWGVRIRISFSKVDPVSGI